jgi:hypothetical protein
MGSRTKAAIEKVNNSKNLNNGINFKGISYKSRKETPDGTPCESSQL